MPQGLARGGRISRAGVAAGATLAVLVAGCTATPPGSDAATRETPSSVVGAPSGGVAAPTESPAPSDATSLGPLRLVLKSSYLEGTKVPVKLHNAGTQTVVYNPFYQACRMTYVDETGRKFLIPEGTHCDLVSWEEVAPGDTVTLFEWDLDECTRDEWGCMEKEALAPGRYTIKGRFRPARGGTPLRAEATFAIEARDA